MNSGRSMGPILQRYTHADRNWSSSVLLPIISILRNTMITLLNFNPVVLAMNLHTVLRPFYLICIAFRRHQANSSALNNYYLSNQRRSCARLWNGRLICSVFTNVVSWNGYLAT